MCGDMPTYIYRTVHIYALYNMSLEYAILGFLNYGPSSGYDLKNMFDTSIRHFWSADQSQIYRTLAKLVKKNWVTMHLVEQSDKPNRKVYSITETGKGELYQWLKTPLQLGETRNALLIQIFFGAQLDDKEIISSLKHTIAQLNEVRRRHKQIPEKSRTYVEMIDSQRDAFFWMLTLEMGARHNQVLIDWAESAIRRIEARDYTLEIQY